MDDSGKLEAVELPKSKVITIAGQDFKCAEVMFKPSFIGRER